MAERAADGLGFNTTSSGVGVAIVLREAPTCCFSAPIVRSLHFLHLFGARTL